MRTITLPLLGLLVALTLTPGNASAQDDEQLINTRLENRAEAELLRKRAMGLARRGKYEEAYTTFASILPLLNYPDDQVLYNLGAIAYEALKDCRRALLYFDGYLYAAPGDPSAGEVRQRRKRCLTRLSDTGSLVVEGSPKGASVRVNDVILGRVPLKALQLPSGTYRIDAEMQGYENYRRTATVDAGLDSRHAVQLTRKIFKGNLKVETTPPGATVFVNEVKIGISPVETKDLPTKRYLIRIEKEGMDRWIRYVTIDKDQTLTVSAELESTGVTVQIPPLPR